ncbi:unnamed protein product [Notodromas monacha]|uniref:Nuclear cap-binding protein subunit 1 n=1 Tax=Notodromas monacha TaxID=399045 RepID=A0A7R9BG39_9CRUS|nr:unnamed protein product [Notodromas monacha]CAG0913517.1 unnamed protein product [Notodromas monacha]
MNTGGRRRRQDDDGEFRGRKRRRNESIEIEERFESLIVRLGERSNATLENNIEGLAEVLDTDLAACKGKILKILCDCFIRSPEKCTIYTTLIGMMNIKDYSFGAEVVEALAKLLKEFLKNCDWYKASLIVRTLADMGNARVVSLTSIVQLFDVWMCSAEEPDVPQVRRDLFAYAVMYALPWIGKELREKQSTDFDKILARIHNYMGNRSRVHVDGLRVWSSDDPHPQEEYMECLWEQIQKMRGEQWTEKHLLRPYNHFATALNGGSVHSLPSIIPPPHHNDYRYPKPRVVFRMFDYTDCPEGIILPGSHSIERFFIEDQVAHVVYYYHDDRKLCANMLVSNPYFGKIPMEYVIVEVVMGGLFTLPRPPYLEVFYGSLLIELCKLIPATLPQVLAQATEMLFDRISTMDPDCCERFVSWFAYHLSNYQFRWSWDDWVHVQDLDPLHPKAVFVRESLLKALRLTYHKRIVDLVPKALSAFVPAEFLPHFKYMEPNAEALPLYGAFEHLFAAIRQKCSPEEALEVLGKARLHDDAVSGVKYTPSQIELFVQTLLYMGAKSFSHSFAGLAKFKDVLKQLAYSEDAQLCILRSLHTLWKDHQQMQGVIINKMLRMSIIECSAVANWIFSKEMTGEFTKMYVWEILHQTISKMSKHVTKVQNELREVHKARQTSRQPAGQNQDEDSDSDGEQEQNDRAESVNEEMLEKLEEQFESAQADQKNMFLIIFQRFIMLLSEHIVRCDTDGRDFRNWWYYWTLGRLKQVFMMHEEQVYQYKDTLETLLFTQELDHNILQVFQQMLQEDELRDAVLLVFANKQDLPNAMSAAELTEKLGLRSLVGRKWYIQATCASQGQGLYEGLDWLSTELSKK